MKLRNPFWIENLSQDQPYDSLLLIAPKCDFSCKYCFNTKLGDAEVVDFSVERMVEQFKSNPFVDGITIGGLEIALSGEEFICDLLRFIQQAQIENVTIYTRFNEDNMIIKNLLYEIQQIPSVLRLYLKTGMYNQDLDSKIVKIGEWSIRLASHNQDFQQVK